MILDEIKAKLEEVDPKVFYGMVKTIKPESLWNYIVFDRRIMRASEQKTGYTDYYRVHIVREGFIPEGIAEEVIEKMKEIAGFKVAKTDMPYTYVQKGNTDVVVEMLTIEFLRARKV